MPSPKLLKLGLNVLKGVGLTSIQSPSLRGQGMIFCLHHVFPGGGRAAGFSPNNKLAIEPEFLAATINLARSKGFDVVSLGEAVTRLRMRASKGSPFAVFTLDDGYRDNLVHALPVFERLNCPFTVFIAPKIADGTCVIWWRVLELVIAKSDAVTCELPQGSIGLATRSLQEKQNAYTRLFSIFENLEQHEQRVHMRKLALNYGVDSDAHCRGEAMNWDEIRQINRSPLCTIGAHTVDHFSVGRMSAQDALTEMVESRKIISEQIGENVAFNAYPYGDAPNAGARDFQLAADAGYEASLTTRKGMVFADHADHLQALPRLMVSGRYQELKFVEALISGLPFALLNRFRKLNVA